MALKYEDEETYRYLIASDLSWRTLDIVQGQTLRWLVEVFVQDWKGHEGWAQLTKQPGEEGARRSVILSLLVDHALFVHPAQEAQLKNNLPAYTVGSLRAHVQVESLVDLRCGKVDTSLSMVSWASEGGPPWSPSSAGCAMVTRSVRQASAARWSIWRQPATSGPMPGCCLLSTAVGAHSERRSALPGL